MRLEDRTVFITGAASGIGRQTALSCAAEGAHVVATDVDEDAGAETVARIEEAGAGSAEFRRLDVTDGDAFAEVVDAAAAERGLDAIVNNAGIGHPPEYVEDIDASVLEYVLDVNLRGVWHGCQAALPHLKENDEGGAIVNVASLAGFLGFPKQSVYSMTKGAVLNFTRAVAAEAGPAGVRANAVCPGFVDTPLGQQYFEAQGDPEAVREKMARQYPLRRLGEPEEIADPIVFLLSDEASWLTGHGLTVDGGFSSM